MFMTYIVSRISEFTNSRIYMLTLIFFPFFTALHPKECHWPKAENISTYVVCMRFMYSTTATNHSMLKVAYKKYVEGKKQQQH